MLYEVTFAAASANISTGGTILSFLTTGPDGVSSNSGIPSQVLRTTAHMSTAAATATIALALVEPDAATHKVIGYFTASVAATARRSNLANDAGDYMADVIWADSGSSKFDLLAHDRRVFPLSGTVARSSKAVWYILCPTLSAGTVTVCMAPSRAI